MTTLKFKRGESTKETDAQFKEELLAQGWAVDGEGADSDKENTKANEQQELLEKARALGLTPHHKTGVDKLRELIEKAGE